MGGFAAWYSCPVCAYRSVIFRRFKSLKCEWDCTKMVAPQIFRICSGCASVDVPDYKDKDKFKMENLLIGQFMQHITAGPKVITNSEINSRKVILDHFRKRRGFQRPTVGPRLYQDKFPDWSKSLGEWFFLETYRDYYTNRENPYYFNKIFSLIKPQSSFFNINNQSQNGRNNCKYFCTI